MIRRVLVAAALVSAAAATPAGATTFCVADPGCVGINVADLGSALSAAAAGAGPDRVQLGPGTFTSGQGGFIESTPEPIEVVGAGAGATVLTAPNAASPSAAAGTVLDLQDPGAAGSVFHDLAVRIPVGASGTGIVLRGGTATRVRVEAVAGSGQSHVGVRMTGASTLSDATVNLPLDKASTGVSVTDTTGPLVLRSSLTADRALSVLRGAATARLLRARATASGLLVTNGSLDVDGALVRIVGPPFDATGLWARSSDLGGLGPSAPTFLVARHATLLGSDPLHLGIAADSALGSATSVSVSDSVVAGFGTAIKQFGSATGRADVAVRFSDLFAPTLQSSTGPGGVTVASSLATDPLFVDAAGGDLRPRAGSPLIDAGDPAGLGPSESATDIDGAPRIQNGRRDMGAFETTAPAGAAPGGPIAPPGGGAVTRVPLLRGLTTSSKRIRARCGRVATTVAKPRSSCSTSAVIALRLGLTARVRMTVTRVGKRKVLRSRTVTTTAARLTLRIPVRQRRSVLAPGAYRATILVTGIDDRTTLRTVGFRVLPPL